MLIVAPIIDSTDLAIVAEADLRCGDFFSAQKLSLQLVVSTSFWSWLLNVSSVLTTKKYTATVFFWFVKALRTSWWFMGVLCF